MNHMTMTEFYNSIAPNKIEKRGKKEKRKSSTSFSMRKAPNICQKGKIIVGRAAPPPHENRIRTYKRGKKNIQ